MRGALKNHPFFVADAATPEGKQLCETFGVRLFPTFILLDSAAEPVARWIGFSGPDDWTRFFEVAAADPVAVEARRERYRTDPTVADAVVLGRNARTVGEHREAEELFRDALEIDRETARRMNVPILRFRNVYNGIHRKTFRVDEAWAVIDALLDAGDLADPRDLVEVAVKLVRADEIMGAEDVIRFLRRVRPALKEYEDPEFPEEVDEYRIAHLLLVEKDGARAADLKKKTYPDDWRENPGLLNAFAWWCFENRVDLDEAERFVREAIARSETEASRASYMDTLAEIRCARGDREDALAWIEKARELNPGSGYLKDQEERFRGLLEKE